jgi:hypothetical protein
MVFALKLRYLSALVIEEEEGWNRWESRLYLGNVSYHNSSLNLSESLKSNQFRILDVTRSYAVVALDVALASK